jgi:hypothetical protein
MLLLLLLSCFSAELPLQAGAAQVEITPTTPGPMWGYAARKDDPSTGVRDPLMARCLVLDTDGKRVAFISLDLGRALPRGPMAALEKRAAKHGVQTLFVAASHTHHGPTLEIDTWPTPKSSYVHALTEKLGDLIESAVKQLQPARVGVAGKEVPLNRNRHTRGAATDRELLVLRAETLKAKPIAHLVNFAAHPTMLPMKDYRFSADWVGVMARTVEKKTDAPCLFLQGAAGDVSTNAEGSHEKFGQALANEVLQIIGRIKAADLATGWKTREESFTFPARVAIENPVVRLSLSLAFSPKLVSFFREEYKEGVRPRLTTALLDGRIGFVGVSGEFFADHSLHLKRRARLDHLFVIGYCNDYQQYFPTIEAAARGGYGTEIYIAPAEIGAGEKIMDRALIHLYAHRGKFIDK